MSAVEKHNGLIRRFILKEHLNDEYNPKQISFMDSKCNGLTRKNRIPEHYCKSSKKLDRICTMSYEIIKVQAITIHKDFYVTIRRKFKFIIVSSKNILLGKNKKWKKELLNYLPV